MSKVQLPDILFCISGFCVFMIFGLQYLWGNISSYAFSYFKLICGTDVDTTLLSIIFPTIGLIFAFFQPFSVWTGKHLGYKNTIGLFNLISTISMFASSYFKNFWVFYFFFGIAYIAPLGITYMIPIYAASKLYPNNKGIITGIMTSGFGISTCVSGYLFTMIINPSNEEAKVINSNPTFPINVAEGFPFAIRMISLYMLVLTILSYFCFIIPQEKIETSSMDTSNDEIEEHQRNLNVSMIRTSTTHFNQRKSSTQSLAINNHEIMDLIKTRNFIVLCLVTFFICPFFYCYSSNFKFFGLAYIPDDNYLTIVGSVALIANSIGRLFWGKAVDLVSDKTIFISISIVSVITAGTLSWAIESKEFYLLSFCVACFCLGGIYITGPFAAFKYFGVEYGTMLYTIIYFFAPLSNFLQFFLTDYLYSSLGLGWLAGIFTLLSTASLISSLLISKENVWEKNYEWVKTKN